MTAAVAAGPVPADGGAMSRRQRIAADAGFAVLLAVSIGAVNIWHSFHAGRLSAPPAYDDVVYLTSARQWIVGLGLDPVMTSVRALFDQHAPLWTWVAIIGFVVSGGSEAGPYAAASSLLVVYFLGLLSLLRPLPLAVAWSCIVGVATLPFVNHIATEFRPDLIHGACLGLYAVALLQRSVRERSRSTLLLLGAAGGLLLIAKPTAFLPTIALGCTALALRLVLDRLRPGTTWSRDFLAAQAKAILWFCAGVVLVAGPTFVLRYSIIFDYVYRTIIGRRDLYRLDATFVQHLQFYSVGFGGFFALGRGLWVALATFVPCLLVVAIRRDGGGVLACVATAVLVAVAYAIPTVTDVKTYFLGSMFYGTLTAAAIANVSAVGRAVSLPQLLVPARAWLLAAIALSICGVSGYRLYRQPIPLATGFSAAEAENYRLATAQILRVIRDLASRHEQGPNGGRPLRVMFNSPVPTNPTVIEFYANTEGPRRVATISTFLESDLDRLMAAMTRWDVMVVASSTPHPLPGPRLGDALIARLDQRDDFILVESIAQTPSGVVRIYVRRAP